MTPKCLEPELKRVAQQATPQNAVVEGIPTEAPSAVPRSFSVATVKYEGTNSHPPIVAREDPTGVLLGKTDAPHVPAPPSALALGETDASKVSATQPALGSTKAGSQGPASRLDSKESIPELDDPNAQTFQVGECHISKDAMRQRANRIFKARVNGTCRVSEEIRKEWFGKGKPRRLLEEIFKQCGYDPDRGSQNVFSSLECWHLFHELDRALWFPDRSIDVGLGHICGGSGNLTCRDERNRVDH